jgi:predicted Zn-dependent peptidase
MLQNSVIRPADVDAERQVILEEINMHEDTPDDAIHDLFNETLWPDHPLGRPILGTVGSIREATPAQIRRFYRRHYVPANLVVVAAGNLRHEQLVESIGEHVDTGQVRSEGPAAWNLREIGQAPLPSGRRRVRRRKTEQAHIVLGTNGLSRSDTDRFALGIVNVAVGGGMSSRLFQEVREKRGLAYSVYSYHTMFVDAGLFAAYAGTTPGRAGEVLSILREQLQDVADGGLSEREFERAKGHMKGSLVLSLDDPSGRMSRLGKSEISHGEILTVNDTLKRIDEVTYDGARGVAKRVLSQPMSLAVIGPFSRDAFR